MIRFSASEREIEAMLRFLLRRVRDPNLPEHVGGRRKSHLLLAPLVADRRDTLRFRRTPRPLLHRLQEDDAALAFGLRLVSDREAPVIVHRDKVKGRYHIDAEASRLIVFALGPVQPGDERRRDGVIEARDWVQPEDSDPEIEATVPRPKGFLLYPQSYVARDVVLRCAGRLRRRGQLDNGRWHVPPLLPEDDEDVD